MGSNPTLVSYFLTKLSATFKIMDLGELGFFLSIETINCNARILLSQQRYMLDILKRAGMSDCKPLSTPIPVSKSLSHSTDLYDDPTQYRSLAGALQELHVFSDSNWAGCHDDRKLASGYAVFLGSNLVSWVCKKQRTVARSSTEVEYKGLADVCAAVIWILSLLREIGVTGISVPKLWCDNLGATYLCANPIFYARTKHVEIDYHFVRVTVAKEEIQVNFISTKDQLADNFNKIIHC
ncbi:PREDICTED: uncharacterized protein LOC109157787 [Ipomoea nil]|uniref:uncharacterized protein LOC109157787 n=1 Tax=Ipomoea nil TaxID=35883 RepID=UPI000901683A|nr:PREDICTED: uncharacterized protein LOC109157787 [Ipomoea nil]